MKFSMSMKNGDAEWSHTGEWEGLLPQTARLYAQTQSDWRKRELEGYMRVSPCPACNGKRLKDKVLAVRIDGKSIIDVTDLPVAGSAALFRNLKLTDEGAGDRAPDHQGDPVPARLPGKSRPRVPHALPERRDALRRGSAKDPARDPDRLEPDGRPLRPRRALHRAPPARQPETDRDAPDPARPREHGARGGARRGHDPVRRARHRHGPRCRARTAATLLRKGTRSRSRRTKSPSPASTSSGTKKIDVPEQRRAPKKYITIKGCRENNLKNITAKFPIGLLTVVTGVSGSGKSTLVYETLYKGMMQIINKSREQAGKHDEIVFDAEIDKVIVIDQSPIGKTPRSNPATYTKVFDEIRTVFAETKEAKMRGYKPGRFSFNIRGGRCEACEGDGLIKIEMNFLPDVYIECEECKGKRYNRETLEVQYKGKSIADVLDMSVEEAMKHFENIPSIRTKLETLSRVGLDYIKLGQSSTTLSGGEAQRIKLTRELAKRATGRTLYLLDEPTTGLHFDDTKKLIKVLDDLVEKGNTVIVIEHNLDVVKSADHLIDIGPEGGDAGGEIIATGTPEKVAATKESYTGQFLKPILVRD